jgi:hypothetical protein
MSCNKIIFILKHIINVINATIDRRHELATSDGDEDLDGRKATLNNNGGIELPTSNGDNPFHYKAGVDTVRGKAMFQLAISNDDDRVKVGMDPDGGKATVENNNGIKSELPTSDCENKQLHVTIDVKC